MTEQEVRIFTSNDGQAKLEVALDQETVWLSQAQTGRLFGTTPENALMHLQNIKDEGLVGQATTEEFLVVRREGKRQARHRIKHYNLDTIISAGYRTSSKAITSSSWQGEALNNPTCSH